MSTRCFPAQRLTNTFVVGNTAAPIFQLAYLTQQLTAYGSQQIGSLFVAPTTSAIDNSVGSAGGIAPTAAVNTSLTDLGKTITVQVNNATDGACYMKFREVKYQTATSTFVTGYVIVENNYQINPSGYGKVLVGRA
jgi:hypothetical protein